MDYINSTVSPICSCAPVLPSFVCVTTNKTVVYSPRSAHCPTANISPVQTSTTKLPLHSRCPFATTLPSAPSSSLTCGRYTNRHSSIAQTVQYTGVHYLWFLTRCLFCIRAYAVFVSQRARDRVNSRQTFPVMNLTTPTTLTQKISPT